MTQKPARKVRPTRGQRQPGSRSTELTKNETPAPLDDQESAIGLLAFDGITPSYRRALLQVIAITGSMFLIETAVGHACDSHVLRADALDFLDDTLLYASSLAVVGASLAYRAAVAMWKAGLLALMSLWVLASAIYHTFAENIPQAESIGAMGLLGLAANYLCLAILAPHRHGRTFLRSDGLSPRPDVAGNFAIIGTAVAVWALQSPWPDLLMAAIASGHLLFLAGRTMQPAFQQWQRLGDDRSD